MLLSTSSHTGPGSVNVVKQRRRRGRMATRDAARAAAAAGRVRSTLSAAGWSDLERAVLLAHRCGGGTARVGNVSITVRCARGAGQQAATPQPPAPPRQEQQQPSPQREVQQAAPRARKRCRRQRCPHSQTASSAIRRTHATLVRYIRMRMLAALCGVMLFRVLKSFFGQSARRCARHGRHPLYSAERGL